MVEKVILAVLCLDVGVLIGMLLSAFFKVSKYDEYAQATIEEKDVEVECNL